MLCRHSDDVGWDPFDFILFFNVPYPTTSNALYPESLFTACAAVQALARHWCICQGQGKPDQRHIMCSDSSPRTAKSRLADG